MKILTRNLKHKTLTITNEKDKEEELIEQDNEEFNMTVDKFRNIYEHKCNFYNEQIKNTIVPKIV